MTTRKKAAVLEPTAPEAPPQNGKAPANVLPDLISGTLTEAGFVPRGRIERVVVPLFPELPDLKVLIDVSTAWGITRGDYTGAGSTGAEREAKRAAAFIVGFEGWNFADRLSGQPIPAPDPAQPDTFMPLVRWNGQLTQLYLWILSIGVDRACNQAMGN